MTHSLWASDFGAFYESQERVSLKRQSRGLEFGERIDLKVLKVPR